jgi:hypothetical protein
VSDSECESIREMEVWLRPWVEFRILGFGAPVSFSRDIEVIRGQ